MTKSAKKIASDKTQWVVRSSNDGKLVTQTPTKREALARARFLAVASLKPVPKKSRLTQAQARKFVSKIFQASANEA